MSTGNRRWDFAVGVDVGSVAASVAVVAPDGSTAWSGYRSHHGRPAEALDALFSELVHTMPNLSSANPLYATVETPAFVQADSRVDPVVACVRATRSRHQDCRSLIVAGGERFFLVRFADDGSYTNMRGSSSCAAGTGSFLDQQARRLDLAGDEESGDCSGAAALSKLAAESDGDMPRIASRCSVFAKTDLIHAQQEGYSLPQICDGLCHGLARNLLDTLAEDDSVPGPVVFAGGVSRNHAVRRHIESILNLSMIVDPDSHVYGAVGAAIEAHLATAQAHSAVDGGPPDADSLFDRIRSTEDIERSYQYEPLQLRVSDYPDFSAHRQRRFTARQAGVGRIVEIDVYADKPRSEDTVTVRVGIDIGSTSTKAMLVEDSGTVLAGFYTRTAGAPVPAVQALFEAIEETAVVEGWAIEVVGAATTGSGRSFVGALVGADLILDEISAHARAAVEIDPATDTIIEIGGQDAKFTTLDGGVVTFSQMNTVCAAGTGSFIEEQANKLDVGLAEFADLAEGVAAPLASDRCTVFMERDINNHLNRGYSKREILATALHSVRENYLYKVATTAAIGNHICFQGATAKNRALVAAFEQKLGKPITVSLYCHLTGAYGAALLLADEARVAAGREYTSRFRGLGISRESVPVATEECTLCANNCRIRVAMVENERVAYGFLCGRDYETQRRVSANTSGYDLIADRRRILRNLPGYPTVAAGAASNRGAPVIGLPSGLYLAETLPLWETFFNKLGIAFVTSTGMTGTVARGRRVAGAEFCAPMMQFHGQVDQLLASASHIFLPVQLVSNEQRKRSYCYYSQMAPSIVREIESGKLRDRFLQPLVNPRDHRATIEELVRVLSVVVPDIGRKDVADAYEAARNIVTELSQRLVARFQELRSDGKRRLDVVLLGRPYTVLSGEMNHRIPDLFGKHGVRALYQDMVPGGSSVSVASLISEIPWSYAARILEVADVVARTDGLYPVLVTSFKCSPDSFIVDYFKKTLGALGKPYLILQLDDHNSSVGYETRIEASLRAFRNHYEDRRRLENRRRPENRSDMATPILSSSIDGKTLLFPRWDAMTNSLIVAALRSRGIDTRLLPEDHLTIQRAMRTNSGQCLPVNIIAEEALSYVKQERLDPEKTVLWIPKSKWTCNIPLYPHHIKSLLDSAGVPIGVYSGDLAMRDVSLGATYDTYFAFLFGGILRRLGCMIRPYEVHPGETNRVIDQSVAYLEDIFFSGRSKADAWEEVVGRLSAIERVTNRARPQVAIFGDLYVRDNDTANQNLVETIEQAGGEVVTTPYSDYVKLIANAHFRRLWLNRDLLEWGSLRAVHAALTAVERRFYRPLSDLMPDGPDTAENQNVDAELAAFGMRIEQSGESVENVLKIFHVLRHHPDVSLFVQASPAFCCPSLVTEALAARVQRLTGIPVVSVTYDGTGRFQNDVIVPYLKLAG